MGKFKSLASDTLVYGGSTILVRLLNWLLMPYYIRTMSEVQYGIVTQVYGYIAILLVVLTYGFETSFFRFSNTKNHKNVFTTALTSIGSTSLLFVVFVYLYKDGLVQFFGKGFSSPLVLMIALIVAVDAVSAIIFAKLRYQGKSIRFGLLKLVNVTLLISLNLYFLYWCPMHLESEYCVVFNGLNIADNQAFYVLLSNLAASGIVLLIISSDVFNKLGTLDFRLLLQMYKYSYPILIVGITGMINIQIDKILIPKLIGGEEGLRQLAIYGANFKIGVLMAMFTQSFRLAFEPFFFKDRRETANEALYNDILKYFVLFGLLIFLGVTFFMDIINIVLTAEYETGNIVIPIVLVSQLLSGVYFTLSVWYKITDKTIYGAYMGIVGSIITIGLNILLIPLLGYVGAAIAGLVCFLVMVFLSIYWGNKNWALRYKWRSLLTYSAIAGVMYFLAIFITPYLSAKVVAINSTGFYILKYIVRLSLIIVFLWLVYYKEFKKKLT
ncbi:Membrane protein involved in the export of O-antigen and teichoic acid [Saccharicrinis carchari]|uniref:Membrane protein involved in the export of O-antigen and teichoic acid n=1 Tax=Saccharicrinis carchari TaxID=1168039 RepID=A0A521CGQ7_SACCC|nr:polysaccharide biosynthesis C-terminal domain-containing protein [Saccharicrinis carchari]SMO58599.1 Membrane protein involved in the export of O-antigen and teichoic acid [Saccharicrinis carchari]